MQLVDVVANCPGKRLPGRPKFGAVLLGIGLPRVGQREQALAIRLLGTNQSFVLQLLESGIHRPRARTPDTLAAFGDLLHDLVTVPGLSVEIVIPEGTRAAPGVAAALARVLRTRIVARPCWEVRHHVIASSRLIYPIRSC